MGKMTLTKPYFEILRFKGHVWSSTVATAHFKDLSCGMGPTNWGPGMA